MDEDLGERWQRSYQGMVDGREDFWEHWVGFRNLLNGAFYALNPDGSEAARSADSQKTSA